MSPFNHFYTQLNLIIYLVLTHDEDFVSFGQFLEHRLYLQIVLPCFLNKSVHSSKLPIDSPKGSITLSGISVLAMERYCVTCLSLTLDRINTFSRLTTLQLSIMLVSNPTIIGRQKYAQQGWCTRRGIELLILAAVVPMARSLLHLASSRRGYVQSTTISLIRCYWKSLFLDPRVNVF
jgi:hypothetical protein